MPIFDWENGNFIFKISDNVAIDSDGDMVMRISDHMALDMESGDVHFTSAWKSDDEADD